MLCLKPRGIRLSHIFLACIHLRHGSSHKRELGPDLLLKALPSNTPPVRSTSTQSLLLPPTATMSSAPVQEKQLKDFAHAEGSLKDAEALVNTRDWTPEEEKSALRKLDWCLIPM